MEKFDAYLIFGKTSGTSSDDTWSRNVINHLSIILQRIQNRPANIGCNLDNPGLKDIESIYKNTACLIIQYPDALAEIPANIVSDWYKNSDKIIKLTCSQASSMDDNNWSNFPEVLFYNLSEDLRALKILSPEFSDTAADYWQKLTDLAYEIMRVASTSHEGQKDTDIVCIYLAETTPDQYYNRDVILRELTQYGYVILPDKALSNDYKTMEEEILSCLKKAILSIHLIGNQYGKLVEGTNYSKTDIQNKIAAKYCQSEEGADKLSRLIWISPELKVPDPRQEKFIESLQKDPLELSGGEIIQTPLEILKTIINNLLKEPLTGQKETGNQKNVYLIHDVQDKEPVTSLVQQLEGSSCSVTTFESTLKNSNAVQSHRQNLVDNDGVLIYYNNLNPYWLSSKIKDIMKAPGYGRTRPFAASAILIGDKLKDANNIENPGLQVIMQGGSNWGKDLELFVNQLHSTV